MTLEKPTHSLQYILTLLIYCLASTTSAQVQFSREAVTAEIYHIDSIADTEFHLQAKLQHGTKLQGNTKKGCIGGYGPWHAPSGYGEMSRQSMQTSKGLLQDA